MRRFVLVGFAMALVVASCTSPESTDPTLVEPATTTSVPPSVTTTTTSTAVPVVTTTVVRVPPPLSFDVPTAPLGAPEGWTMLDIDPELFGDATLTDGAVEDGRIVLVGCENNIAGSRRDTRGFPVWVSDGDADWRFANGPSGVGCVTQVEATPFGYFAVGFGEGAVLYSVDGLVWDSIDPAEGIGTAGAGQFGGAVAVFSSPQSDRVTLLYLRAGVAERRLPTLITTTDGETWTVGPSSSTELFDNTDISAVLAGGRGLLTVGMSPGGQAAPTAAVFTSPDGLHWTRVTPRSSDFDAMTVSDVVAFGDGFVAVGRDFDDTRLMASWTSSDGIHWHRSPSPPEEFDSENGRVSALAVTVIDGVLWAVGRDKDSTTGFQRGIPAFWKSADGVEWVRDDRAEATVAIPFVIIDTPSIRIGVWPPPRSLIEAPVQLFIAGS